MLRLSEYLKSGGLLVEGDEIGHEYSNNTSFVKDNDHAERLHLSTSDKILIKSFAFRDNNGTQLVPDDFPVVICGNNGVERSKLAIDVEWKLTSSRSSNGAYYAIKSWKPDIDKLLEQQNEYDKQQEKPIESKESKMSEFTYGQKIYIKDNTEHDFTFGCYHTDGESILFLFDTGYGRADIDDVKATPFKTELEIAKEKQLSDLKRLFSEVASSTKYALLGEDFLFKTMQDEGLLAEIILPSKDK